MPKPKVKLGKRAYTGIGIAIAVTLTIVIWGGLTNWNFLNLGQGPNLTPTTITMVNSQINGTDMPAGKNDVYTKDVSTLTSDQKAALTLADYSFKATYNSGDSFDIADNIEYLCHSYASGCGEKWVQLVPGINHITLVNTSVSIHALWYADNLNTTIQGTTQKYWSGLIANYDQFGNISDNFGYEPFSDFRFLSHDHFGQINTAFIVNVTFNVVPTITDASMIGWGTVTPQITGNSLIFGIPYPVTGQVTLRLAFGPNLASVIPQNIACWFGNATSAIPLTVQS